MDETYELIEIVHTCGHTDTHTYKPSYGHRTEWIASWAGVTCDECEQARQDEEERNGD